jgi:hypothetical protein
MVAQAEGAKMSVADSFQPHSTEQEILAKVIEFFPYPIQIFSRDGTLRNAPNASYRLPAHGFIYCIINDGRYHYTADRKHSFLFPELCFSC